MLQGHKVLSSVKRMGKGFISYLKGNCDADKNVRHLVKRNGFCLLDFPEAGIRDTLHVVRGGVLGVAFVEELWEWPSWSSGSGFHGGAFVEEFWDILKQIHNNDGLHAGVKEAFAQLVTCANHKLAKPLLRPIIANGLLSRLQIDPIDMRHTTPDEDFKWILHTTPDEDFKWILHTTPDEDFQWILHTTPDEDFKWILHTTPDEDFKWILHTTPDEDFKWILHTTPDEDFKWILHTTPDEDFKWILHTTPDEDFKWILHTTPDEDFKWILHTTDHWSKFNLAFPLANKGAHDAAEALEMYSQLWASKHTA
eukprot:Em0001g1904a